MDTVTLKNHVSAETAYVVDDYPYGFRLRCKIRYWLDVDKCHRHGIRLMSQTSNPKKPGLVWNKPKASTYCRFGGCMYLDADGHVQWTGLHEYMDTSDTTKWIEVWGSGVPEEICPLMEKWARAKVAYEIRMANEVHG